MESTGFSLGSGENKMIMDGGFDTGFFENNGKIFNKGSSTGLSIGSDGRLKKDGSNTGYIVVSGGRIMKESDEGYSINWLFS